MAENISIEELADSMYKMVEQSAGKKKLKAQDLVKEVIAEYGEDKVSKSQAKEALRQLIDSAKCIYTYFGGSFVELPPKQ